MALVDELPEGLVSVVDLGVMAEEDGLEEDAFRLQLAELIIRCMGVLIRRAGGHPEWSIKDAPYEVRVIALSACRRVFNNPQNQQRIQTGPLGESYAINELTGLALKDDELAILESFADESPGSLGVLRVDRADPITEVCPGYDLAMGRGLSPVNDVILRIPSLSQFLGIPYDDEPRP